MGSYTTLVLRIHEKIMSIWLLKFWCGSFGGYRNYSGGFSYDMADLVLFFPHNLPFEVFSKIGVVYNYGIFGR